MWIWWLKVTFNWNDSNDRSFKLINKQNWSARHVSFEMQSCKLNICLSHSKICSVNVFEFGLNSEILDCHELSLVHLCLSQLQCHLILAILRTIVLRKCISRRRLNPMSRMYPVYRCDSDCWSNYSQSPAPAIKQICKVIRICATQSIFSCPAFRLHP